MSGNQECTTHILDVLSWYHYEWVQKTVKRTLIRITRALSKKWTRNVQNTSQGFHVDATRASIKPCSCIQYSQNHMHRDTNDFYTTIIFFYSAATMQHTTSKHPHVKPKMSVLINVQCLNVHMLYLAWLLKKTEEYCGILLQKCICQ